MNCQSNQETDSEGSGQVLAERSIREEIKAKFKFIWKKYTDVGYGKDEVKPISGGNSADALGGWSVTLVDSLSTLYVMGMKDEFKNASNYAKRIVLQKVQLLHPFLK